MNTWTWKSFDASKAEAGDVIVDDGQVVYIERIRSIKKAQERELTPEFRITRRYYSRRLEWAEESGSGFGFDCFEDGSFPERTMFTGQFTQEYVDSLLAEHGDKLIDHGVETYTDTFSAYASIRCDCGEVVWLTNIMTNTCDKCERDYSQQGRLLAPRSQWGWDTGESLSDILAADRDINDRWDEYDF